MAEGVFFTRDLVSEPANVLTTTDFADRLKAMEEIGLDVEQFKKDSASANVKGKVNSDLTEASKLGVSGTPGFFINGRFTAGAKPFSSFKVMIDEELQDDKG